MRKMLAVLSLAASSAFFATLNAPAAEPKPPDVVEGNTAFATDLYQHVSAAAPLSVKAAEGNVFLSPYSISTALAMTHAGARENTAAQMAKTLHFALEPQALHPAFAKLQADLDEVQKKGNVKLAVANALWPQKDYPFLPEFLDLCKKDYGVAITPLDYHDPETARGTINAWGEEKTQKKITNLIPPRILNELTRLVLTNAIYFKGKWAQEFQPALTQPAPFALASGKSVDAPMMNREGDSRYGEFKTLQVLELPYAGNEVSMVVLLPKDEKGIADLEKDLTPANLREWTSGLKARKVIVFLPKFKITAKFRLDDALKAMGMTDAFDRDKADFSGMDGKKNWLFISAVLHKAFVEVNEEGTEAAAATAVVMQGRGAMPAQPPTFRADHPFLFLLRENRTGSVLFLGRLADPTKTE